MVYGDLKPQNIVLTRYIDKENSDLTIYKPCYRIKIIDLASINYLKDIPHL